MSEIMGVVVFFSVFAVIHYLIWGEFTELNLSLPFAIIDLLVAGIVVGILWGLSSLFKTIKDKLKG